MIFVCDHLSPEDEAMLQALYSRSPKSILERLPIPEKDAGKFMDKFYIGYGHKSIGDCGTTTIFIENVSMLHAKAIQDWPLYSGQESSTRYMDFSNAVFANPTALPSGEEIQERWRQLYLSSLEPTEAHIRERYPMQPGESETKYNRAVKARTFDVLRSMLPAGASTNLSWHTNLRQASDHLEWLLAHPDPNVSAVATDIYRALADKYPGSFGRPLSGEHRAYYRQVQQDHNYLSDWDTQFLDTHLAAGNEIVDVSFSGLRWPPDHYWKTIDTRPRGAMLPRFLGELGQIVSQFWIDFGSFRDVQRHRNGIVRMPLIKNRRFAQWYLDEMPDGVRSDLVDVLATQGKAIDGLDADPVIMQYYLPMGTLVPVRITQSLPAFIYRMELRSGKTVHPTLRRVIHEEIRQFLSYGKIVANFPGFRMYVDMDQDSWTLRRGSQTITPSNSP